MERDSLDGFIENTVSMARLTAPDPFSGLPDSALHRNLPDLELSDAERGIVGAMRPWDWRARLRRPHWQRTLESEIRKAANSTRVFITPVR